MRFHPLRRTSLLGATCTLLAGSMVFAPAPWALHLRAADCDGNGIDDHVEVSSGGALDCNRNGRPDACDLRLPGLRFEPGRRFPLPWMPDHRLADLDGDGIPDLIVERPVDDSVVQDAIRIYYGRGAGDFRPPRTLPIPAGPRAVRAADVDGDDDLDLIIITQSQELRLLENRGGETFLGRVGSLPSFDFDADKLAEADLDADGDLDLAVAGSSKVAVLLGDGAGGFDLVHSTDVLMNLRQVLAADLDGDGAPEIIASSDTSRPEGGLWALRNLSGGAFGPPEQLTTERAPGVHAGDLNGDGAVDLVGFERSSEAIVILSNRGDGSFAPGLRTFEDRYGPLILLDLDEDGDLDVASSADGGTLIRLLLNDGIGNLLESRTLRTDRRTLSAIADLDLDGRLDLLLASPDLEDLLTLLQTPDPASFDCNENGIPDECELASGGAADCNENGIPDDCEIASGAAADCNRNGVPDDCELSSSSLSFSTSGQAREAVAPVPLFLEDFDGDGRTDLLVRLRSQGGQLSYALWLQREGGGLARAGEFLSRRGAANYAAADMDGDGALDFLTSGGELFRNAGGGRFALSELFAATATTSHFGVADFDRDGDLDVAFAFSSGLVLLFDNDGAGSLEANREIAIEVRRVFGLAAADFSGNGATDLAVAASQGEHERPAVLVLVNRGDGELDPAGELLPEASSRSQAAALAAADLDGDGAAEIVHWARGLPGIVAYGNDGSGSFTPRIYPHDDAVPWIHLRDLDGDGAPDALVGGALLSVLWNGEGQLAVPEPLPLTASNVALGDIDRDGRLDVAVPRSGNTIVVYRGMPGRRFVRPGELAVGRTPVSMVAPDLDGDGLPDLVVAGHDDPRLSVFLSRKRTFEELASLSAASWPLHLAAGDFDGDGKNDVALSHAAAPELRILLGNGDGTLRESSGPQGIYRDRPLAAADLDGDGAAELVSASSDLQSVAIVRYANGGRFEVAAEIDIGSPAGGVSAGDVDGDGDLDLVLLSTRLGSFLILENRGEQGFHRREAEAVAFEIFPTWAVLADLDGDGDLDAALSGFLDGQAPILLNDGAGRFSLLRELPIPRTTALGQLAAADLDGDGLPDLAVAAPRSHVVHVFQNLGMAAFALAATLDGLVGPSPLVAADFDGNGAPDLAVANQGAASITVFHNLRVPIQAQDCNQNGIPDDCEISRFDCNGNGLPDDCDIAAGTSSDADGNGIPDECAAGRQLPGDCNGDGKLDISDSLCLIGVLFLGRPPRFPCGDGTAASPSNLVLLDAQPDGRLDISDAIAPLKFLFGAGPPHPLLGGGAGGGRCIILADCPDNPACR
jgi:hypothetical protein